jgi:hypothetical protein
VEIVFVNFKTKGKLTRKRINNLQERIIMLISNLRQCFLIFTLAPIEKAECVYLLKLNSLLQIHFLYFLRGIKDIANKYIFLHNCHNMAISNAPLLTFDQKIK